MLSVAKVKLHGLKDDRWKIEDKLSQYKGLINLFNRDRKIVEFDYAVQKKKTRKELSDIQKEIALRRDQLSNLIRGDRQLLRNKLQEHKPMQLKYQNLHPKDALDRIGQEAFSKRKELDLLKYKKKQRSKDLADYKLYLSVLEDRIKYVGLLEFPAEKQAEIITGKVQDAILKKEAALVVHQTYKDILSIMKKDAVYYEAVLTALQVDGVAQGACLIRTTELGQLAMEYLDDRREEYVLLEASVKRDMKVRLESLSIVQDRVQHMHKNMHLLIRRDSDINLCKHKVDPLPGEVELKGELQQMEKKLHDLKAVTGVSHIDQIFICLNEQRRQRERLKQLSQMLNTQRDVLENRHNHAQLQQQTLINSVAENTFVNMELKKELQALIDEQMTRKKNTMERIEKRNDLLGNIRTALLQINDICKVLADGPEARHPPDYPYLLVDMPEQPEHNTMTIIEKLYRKLTVLIQHHVELKNEALCHAENEFQTYIQRITRNVKSLPGAVAVKEESLIDDVSREDTEVLSRAEVKSRSDKIVEQNQKSEFDVVGAPPAPAE